jgi:MOB kinase activator 1
VKTPLKVSASEYANYLMTWVENQFNNEQLFPTTIGVMFPRKFLPTIKVILKRLFRVYAHIYHSHFPHIMSLGMECHLNTCFKHFLFFIDRYKLVEEKDLAPLSRLI